MWAGLLTLLEASFIGVVAGAVVREDWDVPSNSPTSCGSSLPSALVAGFRRKLERRIDRSLTRESEDEHLKKLLAEVLDERSH